MSWKFTDESSVTFQSSVSGPGEFSLSAKILIILDNMIRKQIFWYGPLIQFKRLFQNYSCKIGGSIQIYSLNKMGKLKCRYNVHLIPYCFVFLSLK